MLILLILLYIHRTVKTIRDGEPKTATSTFTQLLNSVASAANLRNYILPQLSVPLTLLASDPPPTPHPPNRMLHMDWTQITQQAGTGLRSHSTQGLDSNHISYRDWTQIT